MKINARKEFKLIVWICLLLLSRIHGQDSIQFSYHGLSLGNFNDNEHGYYSFPSDTITESYALDYYSWSAGYNFEIQTSNRLSWLVGCDAVSMRDSRLITDSSTVRTRLNGYHAWIKARFYYLQRNRFQLFTGLGAGLTSISGVHTRIALNGSTELHQFKSQYPGVYVELLGARVRVGENFGLLLSLNTNPIPFRMGLTYRVPYVVSNRRMSRLKSSGETRINGYTKSTKVLGFYLGYMHSNEGGIAPLSLNFTWENFVKDNMSLGVFMHYSRGVYFLDDLLNISNGWGTSSLLNGYKECQLTNIQASFRATKYMPIGKKWKFFFGGGLGLRTRLLPGLNTATSGPGIMPIALNGYYGFQCQMDANLSFSIQSGFIPNLLQLGFSYRLNNVD